MTDDDCLELIHPQQPSYYTMISSRGKYGARIFKRILEFDRAALASRQTIEKELRLVNPYWSIAIGPVVGVLVANVVGEFTKSPLTAASGLVAGALAGTGNSAIGLWNMLKRPFGGTETPYIHTLDTITIAVTSTDGILTAMLTYRQVLAFYGLCSIVCTLITYIAIQILNERRMRLSIALYTVPPPAVAVARLMG